MSERNASAVTARWFTLAAALLVPQLLWAASAGKVIQEQPVAVALPKPGTIGQVNTLEVMVLSTMLTDRAGVGEWGFSALVEVHGRRILFDTGARPETVLQNARELKIDLSDVTDVILSHHHGDHVGGLLTLRRELMKKNPHALERAYVGAGIFRARPGPQGEGDQRGGSAQEAV